METITCLSATPRCDAGHALEETHIAATADVGNVNTAHSCSKQQIQDIIAPMRWHHLKRFLDTFQFTNVNYTMTAVGTQRFEIYNFKNIKTHKSM